MTINISNIEFVYSDGYPTENLKKLVSIAIIFNATQDSNTLNGIMYFTPEEYNSYDTQSIDGIKNLVKYKLLEIIES